MIVSVAMLDLAPRESVAWYFSVVVPFQFGAGVNVNLLPVIVAVPAAAGTPVVIAKVWESPSNDRSTSRTGRVMVPAKSSAVVSCRSSTDGASFTGVTTIVSVAMLDLAPRESDAWYFSVVVPFQFGAGVNVTLLPLTEAVPAAAGGTAVMAKLWVSPSKFKSTSCTGSAAVTAVSSLVEI